MAAQDSMVAGLFSTPEQYQQAQSQAALQRGVQLAQLDPLQAARAQLYQGGYLAGGAIGGALGGQDPQLQAMSTLRELSSKYDTNTSGGVAALATELQQRGLQQQAFQLGQRALEMRKLEAEAQAKTAERLTPEQKNATAMADASGAERGSTAWTEAYKSNLAQLTAKDIRTSDQKNFTEAVKGGYKGNFNQWLNEQNRSKGTNVNVSTGENAYGTAFGKGIADQDLAKYTLAQKAPEIIATADATEKLLQSDKVFVGTGASAKLNILALGQGLGVTGKNADEVIANTQQLQQQRSQAVLSQIKSSGLGTGQGFTDKDLKFLQDSAAGSITLSKETLQRQVNIERKIARAAAKDWNSRLESMPQKVVGPMGLSGVTVPTQTAFDTVDEAMAAKLPKGTRITVNGRPAEVQ
jgi:hypothetical protein